MSSRVVLTDLTLQNSFLKGLTRGVLLALDNNL